MPSEVASTLESVEATQQLLTSWRVRDCHLGQRNLEHIAQTIGPSSLNDLGSPLGRLLPRCPDPDMGLNNLERFLAGVKESQRLQVLETLLSSRAKPLETLLLLLSTSQFLSDLLVRNPSLIEVIRAPLRNTPSKNELLNALRTEVASAHDDSSVLKAFRAFRYRQLLRIGTNDIVRERPLEEITQDISRIAETSLEVALAWAMTQMMARHGKPRTEAGQPAECVILGFGKLGGKELNYSSDIDIMLVYDEDGSTHGKRQSVTNDHFFGRVLSEVVRLLGLHTEHGQAYRVDLRLRPEGHRGPLVRSLLSTLSYYDTLGRTWERQALIKVRPVAGNSKLGDDFLKLIEPFVYRKYLSFAEINEIKALKRRIEARTRQQGHFLSEVKTGFGGIRDVEFTIQFLQLLNGGDLPGLRQTNTLRALRSLDETGCLTHQEWQILDSTYRFLRKIEHRLQLMYDLQTHKIPNEEQEIRRLACTIGYLEQPKDHSQESTDGTPLSSDSGLSTPNVSVSRVSPVEYSDPIVLAFLEDYREKTTLNRKILDHLLHEAFLSDEKSPLAQETDLILDPEPDAAKIQSVLGEYPFKDISRAYDNLTELAIESVPFLSTRRCRHFLASIAPGLLRAIAQTPDPDMALVNLEKVSASLGGKAALWELFSFSEPALNLYVRVCAWSEFLTDILINNPGMIDELLDSLVLDQARDLPDLQQELSDLCRHAQDPELILHSFQDKELLRVGVRDILGKESFDQTSAELSDLAQTILGQVTDLIELALIARHGVPSLRNKVEGTENTEQQDNKQEPVHSDADPQKTREEIGWPGGFPKCRFVLLGLGKLGGREMSYHSDLDLILVYEGDGNTMPPERAGRFHGLKLFSIVEFYTEVARHIIKALGYSGPRGRLYQVDFRLRPSGQSGNLAISLEEFGRYYNSPMAQLWERQALTRARVVHGDPEFGRDVMKLVEDAAYGRGWEQSMASEIGRMRERVQESSHVRDLKRGFGGLIDIEFLVQLYRLKLGKDDPNFRETNTRKALQMLQESGTLAEEEARELIESYQFLRLVESRLRIVHNRSLDELPNDEEELEKLARMLGFESGNDETARTRFEAKLDHYLVRTRELFRTIIDREKGEK
ncbi:MAG: bifunctional [glutamate--ammonia ligase]-adenylyl-L-tyrosine phosphorylase/[glutamate--ammonia-ligase] adenylyltransferase [Gemmataceae bacterium]